MKTKDILRSIAGLFTSFVFSMICTSTPWVQAAAETPASNIPYSSVLALPVKAESVRLQYGTDVNQYLLGWQSQETTNDLDLLFIHGGCWLSEFDIAHSLGATSALAEYAKRVWSIEYRRSGSSGGGWPSSFDDILAGFDYLVTNKHIDPTKTVVIGHSAGGHLALLLSQQRANRVLGVIGLAAITDFPDYAQGTNSCQQATPKFMGKPYQDNDSDYNDADPNSGVNSWHPRTVLMTGENDSIVPPSHFSNVKGPAMIQIKEAGHFDFIYPGAMAWKAWIQQLDNLALKISEE